MFDGEAFGKQMVEIVKGFVARSVEPLLLRLDALERRGPEKGIDGAPGKDGLDGKDADPELIARLVSDAVSKAVAALPRPEDGKSVTVDDVRPMIANLVAEQIDTAVKALPVPKDGAPGRDGLDAVTPLLKDGVLLFTMSNGTVKEIGRVCGSDGHDGAPGRDGVDGLGFDDLAAEYDGERGIVLRFVRGERVKEFAFHLPVVIDRGVWTGGRAYSAGDAVTWGGSLWIAQKDDPVDKPDGGAGWRLAVKRGRDGKAGRDGELKTRQPVKVS